MVENIAVEKLPGGGTQAVDIMDSITVHSRIKWMDHNK